VDARTLAPLAVLDFTRDVATWSPDGRYLAAAATDTLGVVVDAESLQPVAWLKGPAQESVFWISWSSDGTRIAMSTSSLVVRVFDAMDGEEVVRLEDGGMGRAFGAIFTADGRRILSGADDGAVRSWDVRTGELIATLPGHSWYVYSLALGPLAKTLATGSGDGTVRIWQTRGRPERLALAHAAAERRVAVTPLVDRLFGELSGGDAVLDRLRDDEVLSREEREAALQLALTRILAAQSVPPDDMPATPEAAAPVP